MTSERLKELVTRILNTIRECVVIHTAVVTYDRFISDGYGGYVDASTIGVSDLTKYHWFISEQPSWQQHNQIQSVSANEMLLRCWQMSSPSTGSVVLMRNTKPASFRVIGIRKVGGVLRKLYLSTSLLRKGGGVDDAQKPKRVRSRSCECSYLVERSLEHFTRNCKHSPQLVCIWNNIANEIGCEPTFKFYIWRLYKDSRKRMARGNRFRHVLSGRGFEWTPVHRNSIEWNNYGDVERKIGHIRKGVAA